MHTAFWNSSRILSSAFRRCRDSIRLAFGTVDW